MSDEEQRTEEAPKEDEKNLVFIRATCGCRFQIVSGLPVLNAGVLAMPDLAESVCESHRLRQEEAQVKREEEAAKPKIELVKADGSPLEARTIIRRSR